MARTIDTSEYVNTGKQTGRPRLRNPCGGYRRDSPVGIPVLGTCAELDRVVADTGAAVVVFAVGNAALYC